MTRRAAHVALLCGLFALAAGCASLRGPEQRRAVLQNGFLVIDLRLPRGAPGPVPVVIGPFDDAGALLARGIAVAEFHNDWSGVRAYVEAVAEATGPEPEPEPEPEPDPDAKPVGGWLLAAPRPGIVGRDYLRLVHLSAERNVPAVVDHLRTLPEIDPERIAIAGSSTRGFVALEALGIEKRIAAAAVRVACGDYRAFLAHSSLALAGDPALLEDGAPPLDPDYAEELAAREPLGFAWRFPPRPLLMLNGAADPVVPTACVRPTAEALAAAYARAGVPERFRFRLYEDAGHGLPPEASREALAWWERWLLGAPPPPPLTTAR